MSNKEQYLSSVVLQQSVPIFFQGWWLDIVCKEWNVVLVEKDGEIIAVFPYQIERKLAIKIIRNPLLTPYLGPYFTRQQGVTSPARAQALQELWSKVQKWDSMDILTTTEFESTDFFKNRGFSHDELTTYYINLTKSEAEIFKGINSNHRNLIRQAENVYQISEQESYVERLIALHEATFSRKKEKYPFHPSLIKSLVKQGYERRQGKILAAVENQKDSAVAAVFVVWDDKKMYLLLSAMDVSTAHPGAVRLLIWESIKLAKSMGLTIFDFEGSMDAGIAAFFRRFGGERKTYFQLSKTTSPIWKFKKALLG